MSAAGQLVAAAEQAARQGRYHSAASLFRQALGAEENPTTRKALVSALFGALALDEAEDAIAQNIKRYPDDIRLLRQKGQLLAHRQRIFEAKRYCEDLIGKMGRQVLLLEDLAMNLLALGEGQAPFALLQECLQRDPGNLRLVSNLCYACAQVPDFDMASLKSLQRSLGSHFPAAELRRFEQWNGARRLRIGYICGNIHFHAVSRVLLPIIEGHDRHRVEIFLYASRIRRDARTAKARFLVDHWRSLADIDDHQAAATVYQDAIDVLVDIDGHTAGSRLGVFSRRPAPVQVSAWGYLPGPGTPGIDYLVSDRIIAPPHERVHFPERIIDVACPSALPMNIAPPSHAPVEDGSVKLCVFARFSKNGPPMLKLWASILNARPHAQLFLMGAFYGDQEVADSTRRILLAAGAQPHQVCIEGGQNFENYLERYGDMDLALDTFPYSGGLATLDALSQGTPVVTWSSQHPSARTTESILRHWGLDALIAPSRDAYVPLVLSLIDDRETRRRIRDTILEHHARFGKSYFQNLASQFEEAVMQLRRDC